MSKYTVKIFVEDSRRDLEFRLNEWLKDYNGEEWPDIQYALTPETADTNACFSALVLYKPSGFEKEEVIESAEETPEEDAVPFVPLTGYDFFLMNTMRGLSGTVAATTTQALPPSFSYTVPLITDGVADFAAEEEKPS